MSNTNVTPFPDLSKTPIAPWVKAGYGTMDLEPDPGQKCTDILLCKDGGCEPIHLFFHDDSMVRLMPKMPDRSSAVVVTVENKPGKTEVVLLMRRFDNTNPAFGVSLSSRYEGELADEESLVFDFAGGAQIQIHRGWTPKPD